MSGQPQRAPTALQQPIRFELRGIVKRYGATTALAGVDLRLQAGRILALCGANGSGKSTLIGIMTGVVQPDAGSLWVDGQALPPLTPAIARRLGVQVIFQDLALFANLTVADNIAFGLGLARPLGLYRRASARGVAAAALAQLGVVLPLDAAVETLGIAQRQVVAIARALADAGAAPLRLLILDEPTASLTQREAQQLFVVLRRLQAAAVAIVFVSHRHEELAALADEAVVLRDGHRVAGLLPAQIDADTLALAMLGASAAPRRAPASDRSANHTADQPSDRQPAAPAAARPVVLELRGLSRRGEFGPLDLQLRRGEIVGLTGRLGAGRSELAQTLFGLRRPDAGALLLHGRPLRLRSNRQAIAAGIAYLPEDRLGQGLVLQAAVADNLVLASAGALAGLAGRIDRRRSAQLVDHALRELDIKAPDPAAAVATLSGGNQQRVVLGKWLATQPALLILDAPTVGVDITARAAIHASVRQIAAHGVAVLLISDEVGEVWAHSERVLVMREGRLLGSFDPPGVSLQALTAAVHG